MPNKASLVTYIDGNLADFAEQFGDHFESFTEIEKYDILAAIGLWGSYCAEFKKVSLAEYLREFCPIGDGSDAYDMLIELSGRYSNPLQAMGLITTVASQISESLWMRQRERC